MHGGGETRAKRGFLAIIIIKNLGQIAIGYYTQCWNDCSTVHCPQMGITALLYAASNGHSEIVELLLTAGAATDIRDKV